MVYKYETSKGVKAILTRRKVYPVTSQNIGHAILQHTLVFLSTGIVADKNLNTK